MSTRSVIGLSRSDQSVRHVYCHQSGFPCWNGNLLAECYPGESEVNALLDLGALSQLGFDPADCVPMDRGTAAAVCGSMEEFLDAAVDDGAEWAYLLTPEGWLCARVSPRGAAGLEPLKEVLAKAGGPTPWNYVPAGV